MPSLALTTALGLGGCIPGLPGPGPEPRTFRVTPKYAFADDLPAVNWALVVAEPSAERTLDTNRIAVVTGGINVDYVALAFWIDRAPSMVQTLMVQSFRNSGQIAQVGTTRDRLRPEFLLTSDLRAFQLNRRRRARSRPGPARRAAPAHAAARPGRQRKPCRRLDAHGQRDRRGGIGIRRSDRQDPQAAGRVDAARGAAAMR